MADVLPWPSVLVPTSEDWSLRGGTRSGGQTFEGNEQIVASPTARWKASLTIPCMRREQTLAMRQVVALGRTQPWLVGPVETTRAPWNIDMIGGKITYGRGEKDGGDFEAGEDTSSVLKFRLSGAAEMNATSIAVERVKGGALEPGMVLSIYGRMHTITAIPSGDPNTLGLQAAPGVIGVQIRPWLRSDYEDGAVIEFGRPLCQMRLASDDTGAMELQLSRYGTVTLDLVEAF